ncbi:MAG: HD domain-containing protein [Parcubacteria group bacterium]
MLNIPNYVIKIISDLESAGHEAFVVGGSVRDVLLKCEPKDWDVTTNARPEEILKVFPGGKYENIFGTVIVPVKNDAGETEAVVEVTTYRSEQGYSDRRHPDEIRFEDELDKDLERRDFTINAMALRITHNAERITKNADAKIIESKSDSRYALRDMRYAIIDLFGGQKDLTKKIIRAVGEPTDRFKKDALRMLRAIRFSVELGFEIEPKTERAIVKLAGGIKFISGERIRDELVKILVSPSPSEGIEALQQTKLLQYILPELERGVGVAQNKHHTHTVYKHSVLSLKFCPSKDWRVRFAALLHDIAKPQTKRLIGGDATFYNHDAVGARVAGKIMARLKFSTADTEKVTTLIRNHMFYYNVDEVTAAAVRRLIAKVGKENLEDLIKIRVGDRLGSGVPKAKPYKLRHLEYMLKRVQTDPVSVKMLKINGTDLMDELKLAPGPKIGAILDVLLSEVIEEPKLNTKEYLTKKSKELDQLDINQLRAKAKEKIEEKKMEDDQELKGEFWVK